jgi:hypothetical protein
MYLLGNRQSSHEKLMMKSTKEQMALVVWFVDEIKICRGAFLEYHIYAK